MKAGGNMMLKKINNESVTILSAVASGLVVDALYPSISDLLNVIGDVIMEECDVKETTVSIYKAFINVLLVFLVFFMIWKLCTFCIPSYIRLYEIHKKIRYIPKTPSEEITLFYKVFIDTMNFKLDNQLNASTNEDDFYIALNKTLDLSNRLIMATTKYKDPITLNKALLRTANKNQQYLNYRKYINTYELAGTIDILILKLKTLENVYNTLNFKDSFMKKDITDGISRLSDLKQQVPKCS